jgi:hypothetical protein
MKIYPRKFKAYSVEGQNVFPYYGTSGNVMALQVAIIFRGTPNVLDGGDFGRSEELQGDENGAWIVVKLGYRATDSDVADLVRIAEEKLENWKPEGGL